MVEGVDGMHSVPQALFKGTHIVWEHTKKQQYDRNILREHLLRCMKRKGTLQVSSSAKDGCP
jgi:hypothetical protein